MPTNVAKLRWRCRRGMRELDAVLCHFLERHAELDADDLVRFEAILDLPDPELHAYLVGRHEPADPAVARIIERIRNAFPPAA